MCKEMEYLSSFDDVHKKREASGVSVHWVIIFADIRVIFLLPSNRSFRGLLRKEKLQARNYLNIWFIIPFSPSILCWLPKTLPQIASTSHRKILAAPSSLCQTMGNLYVVYFPSRFFHESRFFIKKKNFNVNITKRTRIFHTRESFLWKFIIKNAKRSRVGKMREKCLGNYQRIFPRLRAVYFGTALDAPLELLPRSVHLPIKVL